MGMLGPTTARFYITDANADRTQNNVYHELGDVTECSGINRSADVDGDVVRMKDQVRGEAPTGRFTIADITMTGVYDDGANSDYDRLAFNAAIGDYRWFKIEHKAGLVQEVKVFVKEKSTPFGDMVTKYNATLGIVPGAMADTLVETGL